MAYIGHVTTNGIRLYPNIQIILEQTSGAIGIHIDGSIEDATAEATAAPLLQSTAKPSESTCRTSLAALFINITIFISKRLATCYKHF
jgi:hypothetical protein